MIARRAIAVVAVAACGLGCFAPAQAQTRHDLVIGIDDYRNVPKLRRAVADARTMRHARQALGFRIRFAENPDRHAMSAAIAGFEDSLEKGDTVGQRWQVREVSASGLLFDGVWTRTGPRNFAAEWRQVGSRDIIRDSIEVESRRGDAVVLYRHGVNGRYFGTLSADGRFVSGHASWYGAGDHWSAAIETEQATASAGPQAKPTAPRIVVVPPVDPTASWQVREVSASGAVVDGHWRRDGSRSFAAEWKQAGSGEVIRDTIEIERQYGNVVVLYRKSLGGRYFGTLSRDGRFIQGHASWYGPGDRWSAEIR